MWNSWGFLVILFVLLLPKRYLCDPIKLKQMFVIVTIAGQQFKVEEGNELFVHRLDANEGDQVSFEDVLLVDQDGEVTLGKPKVDGAQVNASVVEHLKGDKVIVFKKKRRKGYRKKNGHRQSFTKIKVDGITV